MSDRYTAVHAPGEPGFAEYGRHTRSYMLNKFRQHYERQLEQAQKALALSDSEIIVETYVGVWAQKGRQEVTD